MCGIVGGIGKLDFRDYVLNGLSKLNYRGYDSAGLAYYKDGEVNIYKTLGKVDALAEKTPKFDGAKMAIGHTRWATHGDPSEINAHPHVSQHGLVYIVHNGVIDNFRALKTTFKNRGYDFYSKTDTEIIANMLEFYYLNNGHNALRAIVHAMDRIEGSYACAIIFKGEDKLYFMKNASPLLIGKGEGFNLLASDAVPMINLTDKFVDLNDGQYGFLTEDEIHVLQDGMEVQYSYSERKAEDFSYDLKGYPHFMLKEIEESPKIISRLIDNYFDPENGEYLFDEDMIRTIKECDEVVFLACGTSYYASLFGKSFMEYFGKRATCYIASEWVNHPICMSKKPVYVLISQSGETADLIACQKIINREGRTNIAVVNTKGSTIQRKSTFSCLVYAGLEVAVAATKSYMAQVALLTLLLGALTGSSSPIRHLERLCDALSNVMAKKEEIRKIADEVHKAKDVFYIGRGDDYFACLEAALKFKEITYIHAEAYPGGELKHGPIAMIEKGVPVVGFVSDRATAASLRTNIEEVKARNASTYIVSSESLGKEGDAFTTSEVKPYLDALPKVMFGFYLAYFVSVKKGISVDAPRNLAKSVTVQ